MIDTGAIRKKILELALQGKLTTQCNSDSSTENLYMNIQMEKLKFVKEKKIKKQKDFSSISNSEIPFDIPQNWKWVRIGQIFTLQAGKNKTASEIEEKPKDNKIYPCYGGNGLRGYVNESNVSGKHVLIGRQGALCGNINFAENEFWATEHAVVVYQYANTSVEWAGFALETLDLNRYSTSVAQPGLAVGTIENVLIPLPPVEEQKRIADKIVTIFNILSRIDELQDLYSQDREVLKNKLIDAGVQGKLTEHLSEDGTAETLYDALQVKKKKLIDSGVLKGRKNKQINSSERIKGLFLLPNNWKWIRLGEVCEIFGRIGFRGYTKEDIVEPHEGAITISPSNIDGNGNTHFDECTYLSWFKYDESPEIQIENEDIIIVKTGSSYGKTGIVKNLQEKATINPQLVVLKYVYCNKKFLNYVLNSSNSKKQYEQFVIGAAIPTFSQEKLANLLIPLPPIAEQKRIEDKIDELLSLI